MLVEVQVNVLAGAATVWAVMTDIPNAAAIVRGIDAIEVVEQPAQGLVGLRWRETRQLFGKPATAEKWITEAVEHQFYKTRAEGDGFVFLSTTRLSPGPGGGVTLATLHDSQPQTLAARLMSLPMGLLFKGVARKALLQDLKDIKAAAERR
jgi:hypothetical protein